METVVVTGAAAGIGAATARALAGRGFHVLAGVRRESDADAIRGPRIEPVILDITVADHVAALAATARGRVLRAVVNNAGVGVNVPVETYPLAEWRKLFEVNLFGHIAVTQALLPSLVRNRGRVVNVSSVGGRVAMAAYGPYAATKFALEAVSDSLRRELAPVGVDVVVVEPGAVRTAMLSRAGAGTHPSVAAMTPEQTRRYGGLLEAVSAQAASSESAGLSPAAAAEVIAKAVAVRKPRSRYTVGRDAALITRAVRVLSDRALDRVLVAALRPHHPKGGDPIPVTE